MSNINADILSNLFAVLGKKIVVPSDYHAQVAAVKTMLKNDLTGLVSSLMDFSVASSSVNYTIETESPEFTKILKCWLDSINSAYLGKIPSGINPLSEEYFKERLTSSFPILKISAWTNISGILVPSKMFFCDGESIYAKDRNKDAQRTLLNYDYYLGKNKKNKLENNVLFSRPFSRWFDAYPVPYYIKKGIYYNFKLIESLKSKQHVIMDQIIPYLFLIKKGSEMLDREGVTYKDEDLKKVITQYKDLMKDVRAGKTPTRATAWDEELKHLIPDISNLFKPELFAGAERNILSGLGFIDVVEATSTSRRESILNPKVFIEEVKKSVKDFKQLLREIVNLIIAKNQSHVKYMKSEFYINASPITAFHTEEFRTMVKNLFKSGAISYQTTMEICGEVDFRAEKSRILKEKKEGLSKKFYPPITENQEQHPDDKGNNSPKKEINKDELSDDKTDPAKKKEYKNASINIAKTSLLGAPYRNLSELPKNIQKLSKKFQRAFMKSWNRSYYYKLAKTGDRKKAETYAWRVANSVINKLKKKSKK